MSINISLSNSRFSTIDLLSLLAVKSPVCCHGKACEVSQEPQQIRDILAEPGRGCQEDRKKANPFQAQRACSHIIFLTLFFSTYKYQLQFTRLLAILCGCSHADILLLFINA